jgi:type IV secretory pathway VirB2 component (pilin)
MIYGEMACSITMTERLKQQYFLLLAVALACFLPDVAYAQGNSAAAVLCTVVGWFQGPLGRVVAMLGIMAMGVSVMFGKIQITSLFVVVTGIALIFGAQGILDALGILGASGHLGGGCPNTNANALQMMEKPIFTTLGCLVKLMDSSIARALASLAIIFIGLLAMWGRVSWHQATLVGVGIAVIFGAAGLVDSLGVRVGTGGGNINISWSTFCPFAEGINTSISKALCNMINWFNGPIGKGVATLAMIIMGIGALFGKVGWDKTIVLGVGVALIFGATGIVDALGGGKATGGADGSGRDMCVIGQFDIPTLNPTTGTGTGGTGGTGGNTGTGSGSGGNTGTGGGSAGTSGGGTGPGGPPTP